MAKLRNNVEVELDLDIGASATATCTRYYPGRGWDNYSGPEPEEPSEAEDLCVKVVICGHEIDITEHLPKPVRDEIAEMCLDRAERDSED